MFVAILAVAFRALKSAASLKERSNERLRRCGNHFPRSKKRGLIEGGETRYGSISNNLFPRSKKRGLIEGVTSLGKAGLYDKLSAL